LYADGNSSDDEVQQWDPLLDWEHIRFPDGSDEQRRFDTIRQMDQDRNSVISWPFIQDVRETDRVRGFIAPDSPWERLFSMVQPAHREITVEMYSTFRYTPLVEGAPEPTQQQIDEGQVQPEIRFMLFGQEYRMSLRSFAIHSGLYTEEETHQPVYTEAIHQTPIDELVAWWPAIGDGPFTSESRSSDIRDPLYRYLHRLIATSITGRRSGVERCTSRDLFFLRCLLRGTPCHLARGLADYFAGYFRRQTRGGLLGGNFVTRIATSLGHVLDLADLPLPHVEKPRVALHTTASGMRIAKIGPDSRWYLVSPYHGFHPWVPVPLVDPPTWGTAAMIVEEVVEPAPAAVDEDGPAPGADAVDQGPPPPPVVPQYPPRVYTVTRLPPETQAQIDTMSGQITHIMATLDYLVQVDVERRRLTGMSQLSMRPPVYRPSGHPGASSSDTAGRDDDGAGESTVPGASAPDSSVP
jgi:hypothetical protein